jgi:hypothetical protein
LDTGFSISLIQRGNHSSNYTEAEVAPTSVTGDMLAIAGQQEVGFSLQHQYFRRGFYVRQLPTDAHGILGTDCFMKTRARLNFERFELELSPQTTPYSSFRSDRIREAARETGGVVSNIFAASDSGGHQNILTLGTKTVQRGWIVAPAPPHEINSFGENTWTV